MKKIIFKINSLFILIIIILTMSSNIYVIANSDVNITNDGLKYEIDETKKEVTIIDFDDSITNLNIPDNIEGYPVTTIKSTAFEYSKLIKVTIPGTVKNIEFRAFAGSQLEEVEFLDGVTSIGESAFAGCNKLTNVKLPNTITEIKLLAFSFCTRLKKIDIPKSIQVIYSAFNESGISEVFLEDGILSIPPYAFEGCKDLISIKIPDSVTSIGEFAFSNCNSLSSLDIPKSVINIDDNAFYNWKDQVIYVYPGSYAEQWVKETDLKYKEYPINLSQCIINKIDDKTYTGHEIEPKIVIKDGNKRLEENTDYILTYSNNVEIGTANINVTGVGNYEGTTTVTFNIVEEDVEPEKIKGTYGNYTYEVVVETEEMTITSVNKNATYEMVPSIIDGYIVTNIGNNAFYNCTSLQQVELPNTIKTIGTGAFQKCLNLQSIVIPDSVESIGMKAFSNCNNLKTVELGNGLTSIQAYTFDYCPNLQNINIGKNIKNIDIAAFSDCSNLKTITLEDNIETIGAWAFRNCTSLTSLYIPESVSSIGTEAFLNCSGLTKIQVDEKNVKYNSKENCNAIIDTTNNELILGCINSVIPDNVTSIGISAFYNCSNLKNIQIPEKVNNIKNNAFYGCIGLLSIELPDGVTNIGENAFYDCRKLENIKMPKSLKQIGKMVFRNCLSLTSIEIPEGVTKIYNSAFDNCTGLTYMKIPDTVTYIGEKAFYNCNNIKNIELSNEITSIEPYAFCGCNNLSYIEIPDKVTKIGDNAFRVCGNLLNVVIPESVKEIGNDVFAYSNENLTLTVIRGSYAQEYAIKNNIKHIIDSKTLHEYTTDLEDKTKISLIGFTDPEVELKVNIIDKSDEEFKNMISSITNFDKYTVLGAYDISLIGGDYSGELKITFDLKNEYSERKIQIWHKLKNGENEMFEETAENGKVTITVNELSPFLLTYISDTEIKEYKLGDMDKNGEITAYDAYLVNLIYEEGRTPTDEELQIGDIDGDGELTAYDAFKINVAYENGTTLD